MSDLPLIRDLREQPWLLAVFLLGLIAFGYQIVVSLRQGFAFDGAYVFDRYKSPFFFWMYIAFIGMFAIVCAVVISLFSLSYVL